MTAKWNVTPVTKEDGTRVNRYFCTGCGCESLYLVIRTPEGKLRIAPERSDYCPNCGCEMTKE